MPKKILIPLALILIMILAACSAQQTAGPAAMAAADQEMASDTGQNDDMDDSHDDEMASMAESQDDDTGASQNDEMAGMEESQIDDMDGMDGEHDEGMGEVQEMESDAEPMQPAESPAVTAPAWQTAVVVNAATGEPFALGDLKGKTVFVEPMATWCGNCRAQQGHVREAKAQLGDDVVFVGLSLETTLPAGDLAQYAADNGFDWTYAVMSQDLLTGLADEFGRSITSAPSTPHFIIRPDGTFTELLTGIHSAQEIVSQIQEAQG